MYCRASLEARLAALPHCRRLEASILQIIVAVDDTILGMEQAMRAIHDIDKGEDSGKAYDEIQD